MDRIDNSRGYTPDNIQVVSGLANAMKNAAGIEELRTFASWVMRRYG